MKCSSSAATRSRSAIPALVVPVEMFVRGETFQGVIVSLLLERSLLPPK